MQHLLQDRVSPRPGRSLCRFFSFLVPRVHPHPAPAEASGIPSSISITTCAIPWSTGPSISPLNPSKDPAQQRKSLSHAAPWGTGVWRDGISSLPAEPASPGLPARPSPAELSLFGGSSLGLADLRNKLSQNGPITQVNPLRNSKEQKFQPEQLPRW